MPFSLEEAKELASRKALSDDELEAVAGGGKCYVIGYSDGAEAECDSGGRACAFLGVSL